MTPEEKLKAISKIILTALNERQNDTMRLLRQIQSEIEDYDFAATLVWGFGPEGPMYMGNENRNGGATCGFGEPEELPPPPTRLQLAIERNRLKMAAKQ